MLNFLVHSPLLAVILGPLVTLLGNYGQALITPYDKLPPMGKQGVAVMLSVVLVALAQLLPGVVPEACANVINTGIGSDCIAGLTGHDFLTAVLTGLAAIAVKHGQQNSTSAKK